MSLPNPKTLEDFPRFSVEAVRRVGASGDGCTKLELDGTFDRIIDDIDPHWFWLVSSQKDCLCATLQSLNKETKEAVVTCNVVDEPRLAGQTLAYLSPYWQAYHIWMVLDPEWGWKKKQFRGADAFAQNYQTQEIAIVDGREVRVWTKLEPADGRRGASRHYPAHDQNLPPRSERWSFPGGWGHEHCDLCKSHIDAGQFGYCDTKDHWMCENCFQRYVVPRDLAFVDDL